MTLNEIENTLRNHEDYYKWLQDVIGDRIEFYRKNKGKIHKEQRDAIKERQEQKNRE